MPAFTQSLEEQFKSLGFSNYHEMIAARQSMEQISYLSTSEKIELPNGNGTENMVFRFVTYRDERFNSEYILAIFAAVEKKVNHDGILVPILLNEKKFGSGT